MIEVYWEHTSQVYRWSIVCCTSM